MFILVTGGREWDAPDIIEREIMDILELNNISKVVHGGCRGADMMAESICVKYGIHTVVYPAKWDEHGKKAGILRNVEMLDKEKPDLVLAFHHDLFGSSRGTLHMVKYALSKNVPVKIIP